MCSCCSPGTTTSCSRYGRAPASPLGSGTCPAAKPNLVNALSPLSSARAREAREEIGIQLTEDEVSAARAPTAEPESKSTVRSGGRPIDPVQLLTVEETAELLPVSRDKVCYLLRTGASCAA